MENPAKEVWKFQLEPTDVQRVCVPMGAQFLSVAEQRGNIVVYALVDPAKKQLHPYTFYVLGTGHPVRHHDGATFLGTAKLSGGDLMFHIFYEY